MNKIALITGATGMDAKTLTHILISKNYKVILTYRSNAHLNLNDIIDLFKNDLIEFPESSVDFIFMDITDQTSVKLAIRKILENPKYGAIDEFFNFAAQSHVGFSFNNPTYTMQATGMAVFNILDALRELSPRTKFFQSSTSEMFGGNPERCPFNEESLFDCHSPYAMAKLVAYNWVKYFRQTYGMFACSAFGFNHSNIYRHPSFFIQKVCLGAARISLNKEQELFLGDLGFERDETYADFSVEAFWKMLQLDKPEDFVIGRGESFSGERILEEAFGYFNLNWKDYVRQDKSLFRANEVVKLVSDPSKAILKLNWDPKRITYQRHIALMCDWDYQTELGKKPTRVNVLTDSQI